MRKKIVYLVTGLAMTLWITGCNNQGNKVEETNPAAQQTVTTPAAPETAPQVAMVSGTVKQILTGGGFSYILLDEKGQETWYAMPEAQVKEGETITIQAGSTFPNFYSKALDRTFDKLIFSPGLAGANNGSDPHSAAMLHGAEAPAAAASPHGGAAPAGDDFASAVAKEAQTSGPMVDPEMVSPGSSKAVVPFTDLKVAKATGANAFTVGEVFAKAAALNTKKIRVRGQVVKVSRKIMGKNWVHLQDGTGDPKGNTHDLVVTTMGEPNKGDTVTVEGTMSANKDFGAGYRYSAIIEDATISK